MSRSISKSYRTDRTITMNKKFANRRVRRTKDLTSGGFYKKVYESYNINDGIRSMPIPKLNSENEYWVIGAKRK